MVKIIANVFLIFIFSTYSYSQQYNFTENNGKNVLSIESSKSNKIELSFALEEFLLNDALVENITMKNIVWGSGFLPGSEGYPQLPSITKNMIIPLGSTVELRITDSKQQVYENVLIAPSARTPVNSKNEFFPPKRGKIYSQDILYPAQPISYHITEIRGMQILVLSIIPFQYNAFNKQLTVQTNLNIEVNISSSSDKYIEERFRSIFWDQILYDIVFNTQDIPPIDYKERRITKDENACDLLVLTPNKPEFLQWADTIKRFRNEQGILTKVYTTEEIGGNTAENIKAFITEIYQTWDLVPSAILILGDHKSQNDGVLSHKYFEHPEDVVYVSDNYFADITNNDLPDFVIGRIAANNEEELKSIITKYIHYESSPPSQNSYYNEPLSICAYQKDRWFQICSESFNGYMKSALGKNPVRISEIAFYGLEDSLWSTAPNSIMPINYFGPNGLNYIPEFPVEAGPWGDGTNEDIAAAINKGACITIFRDHGGVQELWIPNFHVRDVPLLNNKTKPTFLFSFGCYNGAFDYTETSIIETLHKYNNGGIIGGIAATTWTFSFYNDALLWGLMDNLWLGFLPDYGSPLIPYRDFRPAFGLAAGKYYMMSSNWIEGDDYKLLTSRTWTHFGDPFGIIYTNVPLVNDVTHIHSFTSENTVMEIDAEPLSLVGLSLNGELLASGMTNADGYVSLSFPPQAENSILKLVVSKYNYLRYERDIYVVPNEGALLRFTGFYMDDGNHNRLLEYNENAKVHFLIRNYGVEAAQNVKLSTYSDTDNIIINSDSVIIINSLPAQHETIIASAIEFKTDKYIPDQQKCNFQYRIQNGDSLADGEISIISNSPVLNLFPLEFNEIEGNNNSTPEPGESLNVKLNILNTGHVLFPESNIIIETPSSSITCSPTSFHTDELLPNDTMSVYFQMHISDDAINQTAYASKYFIESSELHFVEYQYFNLGQVVEDWESQGFEKFDWSFDGDKDWEISEDFVQDGQFSASIQGLGDNEEAALLLDYHLWSQNEISFYLQVSTENQKDIISFYIDSTLMESWSSLHLFSQHTFLAPKGDHTFIWVYKKDSINSAGLDAVWLDNILLPPGANITGLDSQPSIIKNELIKINPNPASNFIIIKNQNSKAIKEFKMMNILGTLVQQNHFFIPPSSSKTIDIDNLTNGIYFMQFIFIDNQTQTTKLIIN